METNAFEQAKLEQLHRLYYNLQHRVLPDIILSEQVDTLLSPNPAGEGLLSEAGTTEPAHIIEKAIEEDDLRNHIAEQEERRIELDAFNLEDEVPDFLRDPEQGGYDLNAEDSFDKVDLFKADDEDFEDDGFEENLFEDNLVNDEDEEEPSEQMKQLMAELNEMLELHNVKSGSSNPDENFLEDTWREAWFETALERIPDSAGYTMKRLNQQGYEIVLFAFPEPIQIPDTWMAAAIRKPSEPYRYFTLECTIGEVKQTAVLAEWQAGGMHRNSGNRTTDIKNQDAFLEMIFRYLK